MAVGFWTTYQIQQKVFLALLANLVVCALATVALRAAKAPEGVDVTKPDEYFADEGDPRMHEIPEVVH